MARRPNHELTDYMEPWAKKINPRLVPDSNNITEITFEHFEDETKSLKIRLDNLNLNTLLLIRNGSVVGTIPTAVSDIDASAITSGTVARARGGWGVDTSSWPNDSFAKITAGEWAARTPAQVRSDIGANNASNINSGLLSAEFGGLGIDPNFFVNENFLKVVNTVFGRGVIQVTPDQVRTAIQALGPYATYQNSLGSDVQISVAGIWYVGATVTLPAGTYLINGHMLCARSTTTAVIFYSRIRDVTNSVTVTGSQMYHPSVTNGGVAMSMSSILTLTGTATIRLEATCSTGSANNLIKANSTANSVPNVTRLVATRLN